jgi:PHD/YefM family antitoxin component YafN of YafNO toxin-antitoxin module
MANCRLDCASVHRVRRLLRSSNTLLTREDSTALDDRSPNCTLEAETALLPELATMLDPHDTRPLAEFQANLQEHVDRLRETGRPTILTVDGQAELVVLSPQVYRTLLERLDRAEAIIGIQRGLEDIRKGDTQPLDEAFEEIRRGGGRHPRS